MANCRQDTLVVDTSTQATEISYNTIFPFCTPIIAANPLALDNERNQLRNPGNMQNAVINLLSRLSSSSAIEKLDLTIKGLLLEMSLHVFQGKCKLEQFTPLIDVVVGGLPDTDIWAAVLNLTKVIQKLKTPPASLLAANLERYLKQALAG
ncbi:hypothetical protein F4801DRAFT_561374 [Xylaria longipes]|nr:hypothetical protein F4801DRAFT_561374 [Xylaria longipes]